VKRELRQASRQARAGRWDPPPASRTGPPPETPPPPADVVELERRTAELLAEVRRLARTGAASPEAWRTALVVVDTALHQVRRLLR
jgi:hypothetical protein